MLYKNISSQVKFVVRSMVKTKIQPGKTINLKPSDLNHTGSNMRYFELVKAEELVKKEKLSKVKTEEKPQITKEKSEEESPAIKQEPILKELITEDETTDEDLKSEIDDIVGVASESD